MAVCLHTLAHPFPFKKKVSAKGQIMSVVSPNTPNQGQKEHRKNPTVLLPPMSHCPSAIRPSHFIVAWFRDGCQTTSRSCHPLPPCGRFLSILGAFLFLESLHHPHFSHYHPIPLPIFSVASEKPAFSPLPLKTVVTIAL